MFYETRKVYFKVHAGIFEPNYINNVLFYFIFHLLCCKLLVFFTLLCKQNGMNLDK